MNAASAEEEEDGVTTGGAGGGSLVASPRHAARQITINHSYIIVDFNPWQTFRAW